MVRAVRQVITDARNSSEELAVHLTTLEANKEGNSDLSWRIRDYIKAVDRLVSATAASDRTI